MSEILMRWSFAGWLFGGGREGHSPSVVIFARNDSFDEAANSTSANHDAHFIARLRAGDVDAFEECARTYGERLIRYAARWVESVEQAREIVQDVFLALWRNRDTLSITRDLAAYLFWRTRNHATHVANAERATRAREGRWAAEVEMRDESATGTAAIESEEARVTVLRALAALPPRCQEIFRLLWDDGLSYAEVASVLGISVRTVRNQASRAFRHLIDVLRP